MSNEEERILFEGSGFAREAWIEQRATSLCILFHINRWDCGLEALLTDEPARNNLEAVKYWIEACLVAGELKPSRKAFRHLVEAFKRDLAEATAVV